MPYSRPQCPRFSADHVSRKIHDLRSRGRLDHRAAPIPSPRPRSPAPPPRRAGHSDHAPSSAATRSRLTSKSRNNGTTFTDPVQLNSAPSPPPDPNQFAEDDVSWVAVTTQYVFGAWGDWRPTSGNPVDSPSSLPPSGELNSWVARVPLSTFTGHA